MNHKKNNHVLINLAGIRKSRGLTQKELAEQLLITERTIVSLENGKSTTANNLKRIAMMLRVKPKELICCQK